MDGHPQGLLSTEAECFITFEILTYFFLISSPLIQFMIWNWAGNKPSGTQQPFFSLHLDIYPDAVRTIEDALRLFSAPETLEGYRPSAAGKVYSPVSHRTLFLWSPAWIFHAFSIIFYLLCLLHLWHWANQDLGYFFCRNGFYSIRSLFRLKFWFQIRNWVCKVLI